MICDSDVHGFLDTSPKYRVAARPTRRRSSLIVDRMFRRYFSNIFSADEEFYQPLWHMAMHVGNHSFFYKTLRSEVVV